MYSNPERQLQHAAERPAATTAGERAQYRLNLSTLFGACRSADELDRLAAAAVAFRDASMQRLDARVHALREHFTSGAAQVDGAVAAQCIEAADLERLRACVERHGSVLLAAFHFGDHRRLLVDLACAKVPVVAPIAGPAFFEQAAALSAAPADIRECLRLLDVDSPRVGRDLVRGVRDGRVAVIYADGNMGPGDHLVSEGAVDVDFLGHAMRVKGGIARLSASLQLPVIPLLLHPDVDGRPCRAQLGEPLPPPSKGATGSAIRVLMQQLYDRLADSVRVAPEQWEFMFCLHRWLTPTDAAEQCASVDPAADALTVDPARVTTYRRGGELFWVHLGRQQAYRMPAWSDGLFERLQAQPATHDDIGHVLAGAPTGAAAELMRQLLQKGLLRGARATSAAIPPSTN